MIGTPFTSSITKYGRPLVGRPGIEHPGDVRMIHHRQRLPLGLEAGDHLPRVHPRLDDFQRDGPPNRPRLLGHEDDAHAAFADLLQQLVRPDDRARALTDRPIIGDPHAHRWEIENEALLPVMLGQQLLDPFAQQRVGLAGLVEERRPLGRTADFESFNK